MEEGKKKSKNLNASFVTGAIALVFLIIGYQAALFIHKAAVLRIAANRDRPDTVYVYVPREEMPALDGKDTLAARPQSDNAEAKASPSAVRHNAPHSAKVQEVREQLAPPRESFRFNPNTVSVEDLCRLGFSRKQAQSILNYRAKGGRFHRKEDFAKSYVVADSVYARLEPYIDIPRLDINSADSTALVALPGIGPFFARKIIEYRERLKGYSSTVQLMEIWNFDREKYDKIADLVFCSEPEPFGLWTLPEADLARHPHISKAEAHSIVLYREHQPRRAWTLEGLHKAGVLSEDHFTGLQRCRLAPAH